MRFSKSIYISYYEDLPPERAVELLTEAGFAYGELSEDHLSMLMQRGDPEQTGKAFGQFAKDCGMSITQGHLGFDKGEWMCNSETVEQLKRELVMYSGVGVKNAVLHANGDRQLDMTARMEKTAENIRKVADFAAELGIRICLENLMGSPELRTAESLLQLIHLAGDENLGICLDTGHLHLCNKQGLIEQSQGDFIRTAGSRLQALHVVDNNGLGDTHQMPYSARYGVDWKDVMIALRQVNYSGLFNLEIIGECYAPLPIRRAKLDFIHAMCDYMFTDEFISNE